MKEYLEKMCKEYNAEKDINGRAGGDFGHHLADVLLFEKEVDCLLEENEVEKTFRILEQTDPSKLKNFGTGKVFNGLLKRITNTGYEIKNQHGKPITDFSLYDGPQKWGIYLNLMKEFGLL